MISHYKILHTSCHTQWGGIEKTIFNESVWMEEKGHKIIIVAPKDTPLFLKAKKHGFKVYGIEFKRLSMIKDYKLLKSTFYNERPDIINTHGNKDSRLALLAAKKTRIPLRILSRHNSAHVKNSWYNRMVYKKLCHYIFTSADYTTKHLQKTFKLKGMQIFSMPSGIVKPDHLLGKTKARIVLAKDLGLGPETKFIGFVGRVSKDKGISTLLEAFKKVEPKLLNYHLAIVGEGIDEYINSLKNLAINLQIENRVHFTGFKKDIWSCYRALDCKILPSFLDIKGVPFEGVSHTLIEAMLCECPVIGSESCGNADIIEHEKTGLLFNTDDPSDLADKILQVLQDEDATKQRVLRARDTVIKHHTIDALGRDIIRIYLLHKVKLDRLF